MKKKYLIDYEMSGTLVVESTNPQSAAARGNGVLRTIAKGLSEDQADDTEVWVGAPIDIEARCRRPSC